MRLALCEVFGQFVFVFSREWFLTGGVVLDRLFMGVAERSAFAFVHINKIPIHRQTMSL